jgi:hypothetical protein
MLNRQKSANLNQKGNPSKSIQPQKHTQNEHLAMKKLNVVAIERF